MIDHLLGRPSTSWKRTHVFLVILFWIWRLAVGNPGGPRVLWIRKLNKRLQRFSPWQIIVSTLTAVYAARNLDKIVGLGSPEPLAHLYSPSYYRATWIATGLDAGFATAMSVRPKWLRDICSILFSSYYIIYANEGDEKLRRFRAVPTVEMFRTTWEKTANPYLRVLSSAPNVAFYRRILLPRPSSSQYDRPITVHIYFSAPVLQLHNSTDLILDFPGGGFVAMTPEHHEERLRMWALRTGKVVLAVDYGKAPEYPYPFAMDECFDLYRLLAETSGRCIGMSGKELNVILSGDSAGAALVVGVTVKILQYNQSLPATTSPSSAKLELPAALVLSYAALDFNFTSWMSPDNLRVLRSEQSTGNLPGLRELATQKNHLRHVSPLSMVGGKRDSGSLAKRRGLKRGKSWKDALMDLAGNASSMEGMSEPLWSASASAEKDRRATAVAVKRKSSVRSFEERTADESGFWADEDSDECGSVREEDRPLEERVRYVYKECPQQEKETMKKTCPEQHLHISLESQQEELSEAVQKANIKAVTVGQDQGKGKGKELEPIGTRLTMTSRVGYFQDRIISPSMMRAMAILYIGPHRNPDFATDYFLSPILTPAALLAQFPPLLMQCGEKDPFVDDTVIFAGRVREAKRARKKELDWKLSGGGGTNASVGTGLQMSHALEDDEMKSLQAERDRLARETEDDWVQMVLFKDWSHGYLQMMTLMGEARAVVEDLADWIEDAFVRFGGKDGGVSATPSVAVRTGGMVGLEEKRGLGVSETPCSSRLATAADVDMSRASSSTGMNCTSSSGSGHGKNGTARLSPSPFTSEGETEDSGITFVARKRLGSSGSGSSGGGRRGSFDRRPRTPMSEPGGKEVGTPRGNGGQRITEVELMRRRRLLDAHMFEGP